VEPAGMILPLLLCAFASPQDAAAQEPRPGVAALKDAEKVFALGNPEQARVLVECAIAEMFAARPDALDVEDDRALRDAGALAYKLRSMEPARRAWDAVRRFREKTLDPTSLELQNARGNVSWIGEQMGLVAEARALEEQIVAALEKSLPADHDALQTARANLADTLLQQNEPARALELFTQVTDVRRAKLPAGNPVRLRAELDLASGAVTGDPMRARSILTQIDSECPRGHATIRLRCAGQQAWIAHGNPGDVAWSGQRLFEELRESRAAIDDLPWREAESRTAELGPFVDLAISTAERFRRSGNEAFLAASNLDEVVAHGVPQSIAVYRRWERSRGDGVGLDQRVLVDERLGVLIRNGSQSNWIDLGPLEYARALVRAWDAAEGDAAKERTAVTHSLFAPVALALGNPRTLTIVPDDVIWAVPLHMLELKTDAGEAAVVEALIPRPRPSAGAPTGGWVVIGDSDGEAVGAPAGSAPKSITGGAAASFVSGAGRSSKEPTAQWGGRLGVTPVTGADASFARFASLSSASAGVVLTAPIWCAPDAAPCVTTPRRVVATTPVAAAMAREDVFGGSSPADLCGFLLAGHARPPGEDRRVPQAPRAADLRDMPPISRGRIVVASAPPRADVVLRARDLEALARALIAAGFSDVYLATREIGGVGRATLPADLQLALPKVHARDGYPFPIPGPWMRVRAFP